MQGEEPVRLLVDSIRTMRSSSSLASFLSERLNQISAVESSQEIQEKVLRDFTRQLQALGEELGTLTLQMGPGDAESLIMTLADSLQTSLVARLLVLQQLAEAVETKKREFSRQLQALSEELGTLTQQMDPGNAESLVKTLADSLQTSAVARLLVRQRLADEAGKEKNDLTRELQASGEELGTLTQQMDPGNAESLIMTLADSLLEHPARHKVVEKTRILTKPLPAPAAFALAPPPCSVDGRMFGSQRTLAFAEKPKYMSPGRLFGSERKYQSVKAHVAEQTVQRIVAEVAAAVVADAMPEEDFKAHILSGQLDQLEISGISVRSALTSFTPAKAQKRRDARKQLCLVRHSRSSMQSLEGTNILDLDVETLMESLGEISLVKQVPTLKAHERRLQV